MYIHVYMYIVGLVYTYYGIVLKQSAKLKESVNFTLSLTV